MRPRPHRTLAPYAQRSGPPTFHRALHRLPFPASRWLTVLLLPTAFSILFWLCLNPITQAWHHLLGSWIGWLNLPATVSIERIALTQWLAVDLPLVSIEAGAIDASIWIGTLSVSLVCLAASFLLPKHQVPLRYLLRLAVAIEATSLAFFAFAPDAFHPNLISHIRDGLLLALFFAALVPWLFALTYYIFDFSLLQKFGLTLLSIFYLLLLTPFQYLVHIWLLHHVSLISLPLLFLLFGVSLQILMLIALYGWGMSWKPLARADRSASH